MHDTSGVCQITDISEMALQGKGSEKLYYLMSPIFQTSSRIFTPVDQAQRIRNVSSRADMEQLIDHVPDLEIVEEENNKVRTELFRDMMNQFDPTVLATVVKTVYIRKQRRIAAGKKVMSSDEKVMAVAGKKLFEEMAFALQEERSHVEEMFFGRLTDYAATCIKSV